MGLIDDFNTGFKKTIALLRKKIGSLAKLKLKDAGGDGRTSVSSEIDLKSEPPTLSSRPEEVVLITPENNQREPDDDIADDSFSEWLESHEEVERAVSEFRELRDGKKRVTEYIKTEAIKLGDAACNQLFELILWSRLLNREQADAKMEEIYEVIDSIETIITELPGEISVDSVLDMVDKRVIQDMKQSNYKMLSLVDELIDRFVKEIVRLALIGSFRIPKKVDECLLDTCADELDDSKKELKEVESSINSLKKRMKNKRKRDNIDTKLTVD